MEPRQLRASTCVVGGGPAGIMLGLLLARAGIEVVVLEKHADFLRDFRGDTVHPSTLEVMHELGLLDEFLKLPHQKVHEISGQIGPDMVKLGDFRHLPTRCPFLVLMPQWDFLRFLVGKAKAYPRFHLEMEAEVTDLRMRDGRVEGVVAKTPQGALEAVAGLTVGADGRGSVVRQRAGLVVVDRGAPMDVLWMRISREESDPDQTFGHVEPGRMLVMLNRSDYWQCAYVIPKGEGTRIREKGVLWLQEDVATLSPFLGDRVKELATWDDVHLLTVKVDRLEKWSRPGLLCIGDAAHAMSPIGGVGINLAIQDAIATSNLLTEALRRGVPSESDLERVQARRELPTRATQRVQVTIQERVIRQVLGAKAAIRAPGVLRLAMKSTLLRTLPAFIVGMGFRPEHIQTTPAA